jgi:hypothetical protein
MDDRPLRYAPPRIIFDDAPSRALLEQLPENLDQLVAETSLQQRRTPFADYSRTLSATGGVHIRYRDIALGLPYKVLRVFTWTVATGLAGWLLLFEFDLDDYTAYGSLAGCALLVFLIVWRKLKQWHEVEILPDRMIIDGKGAFLAEDIGDKWPELQVKNAETGEAVISGIAGTRFIEFMTVNRIDQNDRTPEVLAAHLKEAMEQLWGRREVTFR